MHRLHGLTGAFLAAVIISAQAQAITMPSGSKVWMKFEASVCPDADGDDCAGSNRAGPTPQNGIPTTTVTGGDMSATGFAEILPDRVRTFISSNFSAFMHASFEDTYTVHGSAAGPFDITVELNVTGSMSTVQVLSFHQLIAGNVNAEIGMFSPITELGGVPLNEGFRVTPFSPATVARSPVIDHFAGPQSFAIDLTARHTVTDLLVGSTFTLAYGINSAFARGQIDLLNTALIGFTLPEGVFLTSALGGRFGDAAVNPVPVPAALPLFASALGMAGLLGYRRRHKTA
jgi:hypothetical protein